MGFVFFLVLGICSVILSLVIAHAHHQWTKGEGATKISVGVVLAIVAALVVQAAVNTWMDGPGPEPDAGSTPTETSPSPSPTETSPSPSPTETSPSPSPTETSSSPSPTETSSSPSPTETSSSPSPVRTREYYLADLPTASSEKEDRPGNCTNGCTGFKGGAARIAGVMHPNSYLMEVAATGSRSTAVWNLSRSCTELNMIAGSDGPRAPNAEVTFTLSIDRAQPKILATVGQSEPAPITEPIEGAAQIEIAAYVSGPNASDEVPIILGDARVTCQTGSIGDNTDY